MCLVRCIAAGISQVFEEAANNFACVACESIWRLRTFKLGEFNERFVDP